MLGNVPSWIGKWQSVFKSLMSEKAVNRGLYLLNRYSSVLEMRHKVIFEIELMVDIGCGHAVHLTTNQLKLFLMPSPNLFPYSDVYLLVSKSPKTFLWSGQPHAVPSLHRHNHKYTLFPPPTPNSI